MASSLCIPPKWLRLIGIAVLLLMAWLLYSQHSQTPASLPTLKKTFIRNAAYVQYGPFESHPLTANVNHSATFATHTSFGNIHKLQVLDMLWKSPISISIWGHGDVTLVVELAYLLTHLCYTKFQLSISIVVPAAVPHEVNLDRINWHVLDDASLCSQRDIHNLLYKIRSLEHQGNYDTSIPYPNNLLRNIALQAVTTTHVLVTDIDLLPSYNLAENLLSFLHTPRADEPYIIPVFESSRSDSNHWKLYRLVKEWKAGVVRPFYQEPCPQCQQTSGYSKWISTAENHPRDAISASKVVYEPGYEPFFLMKTSSHPKYDERFQRYGYNRLSLVCELHMRGHTFSVLSHVFLIHDGFKLEEAFHAQRETEMQQNYKLLLQVHKELAEKYKSRRTC